MDICSKESIKLVKELISRGYVMDAVVGYKEMPYTDLLDLVLNKEDSQIRIPICRHLVSDLVAKGLSND